ncbi:MAG: radical SAM protein [Deltaproteobacteria bacterium]|nr:radical SAM protein [Deltaproteobacteria bacterium]
MRPDRIFSLRRDLGLYSRWGGRVLGIARELRDADRPVGSPLLLQAHLTTRCNLRCKMCGQWGEQGTQHGKEAHTLPLELALTLVDEAAARGAQLTLWGGEPLLYPHLPELLARATERGAVLGVITNGVLLERYAEALVSAGVNQVMVSLDGPEAVHDPLRGVPGTFQRVMRGLRALQAAKGDRLLPRVDVLVTASEFNQGALLPLHEELAAVPVEVRAVATTLRWWLTDEVGQAYQALMAERLGVAEADSWEGFASGPPPVEVGVIRADLEAIRARRWPFKTPLNPNIPLDRLEDFFTDVTESFGKELCTAPWAYALVLPSGDLTFCPDYPDYTIGNLGEQPFEAIWQGERARAFRDLLRERSLPICARCCSQYLMGAKRPARRG